SYVNQIHRQIDREERGARQDPEASADTFAAYRQNKKFSKENDKRPINNPVTYSLGTVPAGQVAPPVRREYRPVRHTANDFVDSDTSGSLWANQGSSASLFTYQNDKRTGDIVIINVLENLRNQISSELKRVFPDRKKPTTNEDPN